MKEKSLMNVHDTMIRGAEIAYTWRSNNAYHCISMYANFEWCGFGGAVFLGEFDSCMLGGLEKMYNWFYTVKYKKPNFAVAQK